MKSFNWDIETSINNGTIALRVTTTGRLAKLSKKTKGGDEKMWVFKTVGVFEDRETGDERFSHHTAGLVVGTYEEGQDFISLCRQCGLEVQSSSFFVPLSNGQNVEALTEELTRLMDYTVEEVRLIRRDLPSRTVLMATINRGFDEIGSEQVNRPSAELTAVAMDPSQAPAVTFAPGTDEVPHVLSQGDHDR